MNNFQTKLISLLEDYFKPLAFYKIESTYLNENGIINQPLWFYRQKFMTKNFLLEKLEEHIKKNPNEIENDYLFIAKYVLRTNKYFESIQLDNVVKETLLDMIKSNVLPVSNYALSILITYILRNDDKNSKEEVINFFRTGDCKLNDRKYARDFHLEDFFILLTGVKFSGLKIEELNLSGHSLAHMKAIDSNIDVSHFRCCCFEGSLFENSVLSKSHFENSIFFESRILSSLIKVCHFEECIFEISDFTKSTFNTCFFACADFERAKIECKF